MFKALGLGFVVLGFQGIGWAGWASVPSVLQPSNPGPVIDSCGSNSEAVSTAKSNGAQAVGEASAVDYSLFCDPGAENNAEGDVSDFWYYIPEPGSSRVGWAYCSAEATVDASAEIFHASAAVAALGYARVESDLLLSPVVAEANGTALETSSSSAASISFGGVSVPWVGSQGANKAESLVKKSGQGGDCASAVHLLRASGVYTKCWADQATLTFQPGKAYGIVSTKVSVKVLLSTCGNGVSPDEPDMTKWKSGWTIKPVTPGQAPKKPSTPGSGPVVEGGKRGTPQNPSPGGVLKPELR